MTVTSDARVDSFTNANGTYVSAATVNTAATGAVTTGVIDLSAVDGTSDSTTRFLSKDNTWDLVDRGVTGSGTVNKVPLWTGTTALGDSVIAQSSTNIGIGTTTPQQNLEISDPSNPKIRFARTGSYYWDIGQDSSDFQFVSQTGGTIMHLNFDGNVGIGTTAPAYKLSVDDSQANSTIARFRDDSGTTKQTLSISSIATGMQIRSAYDTGTVSYTHLRAHET